MKISIYFLLSYEKKMKIKINVKLKIFTYFEFFRIAIKADRKCRLISKWPSYHSHWFRLWKVQYSVCYHLKNTRDVHLPLQIICCSSNITFPTLTNFGTTIPYPTTTSQWTQHQISPSIFSYLLHKLSAIFSQNFSSESKNKKNIL